MRALFNLAVACCLAGGLALSVSNSALADQAPTMDLPGTTYVEVAATALKQWLGTHYQEYEIQLEGDYPALAVPIGPVNFITQMGAVTRASTRMAVNVNILIDEHKVRAVPVWFKVAAYQQAMLLNRDVARLSELTPDVVSRQRLDVARLMAAPVLDLAELTSLRTRTPMKAGQVITRDRMEFAPDVSKGDAVTVSARSGAIELQTRAVAMDDGATGDWIRVTDPKSESGYRVRIIGKKRAISEGGS